MGLFVLSHPDSSLRYTAAADAHPERSAAVSRGAEGPCVFPTEAPNLAIPSTPDTATKLLRESSPAGHCGESNGKFPPSRAHARRQIDATEEKQKVLRRGAPHLPQLADVGSDSRRNAQDDTSKTGANSNADCILGFKPNSLIDLRGKFPHLVETTRAEK